MGEEGTKHVTPEERERKRKDEFLAEENRRRQIRQGVVSEEQKEEKPKSKAKKSESESE
jgi:hypothetical protein